MLSSTSPRETLLACPPIPPWNLPSFMVESTLSSLCSCSDPPHSCQRAALAHLDSLPPHDLVLWTDGFVPSRLGKGGCGVLANAADKLARRAALLASYAIPCSLSPLISRIHSCIFSDWRHTVSSKFFDT